MKCPRLTSPQCAFGILDVLVCVGTAALAVAFILPMFAKARARRPAVNCLSSLKQQGIAFRIWANDHADRLPMEVPIAQEGAKEHALAGKSAEVFRTMQRELNTPKILACSSDGERKRATTFPEMTSSNVSYFVSVDASRNAPQELLSGDRNLESNGMLVARGLATLPAGTQIGFSTAIHNRQGNVSFADGSAQRVASPFLTVSNVLRLAAP